MNIKDIESWLDRNIYEPLTKIDMKSNMYRILLVIVIAYIVAHLIGIFKIHINYSI